MTPSPRELRTNPHLRQHSVNAHVGAEMTKHGQSRALPIHPIGGITELSKNGRPHRVAPTVVGRQKCVINEWSRTKWQISGRDDDPIATQDAHKWTVIGRGDPVWSPANYAQNCIKAVGVDDPIALRIAHKLTLENLPSPMR